MNNQPKMHFWIPETEVHQLDKKLQARPKTRNVSFKEHGSKLAHSLQTIKRLVEENESHNSLKDKDIVVFNVELPEKVKVQDSADLFTNNYMAIKAVRNERNAVVTSTKTQFQRLRERIDNYTSDGTNKTYFNYIESFEPYIGTIKDSGGLQKTMLQETPPLTVDVQFMLIPDLELDFYESALQLLKEKINKSNGSMPEGEYYLSDRTPVIRAIIPSSTLALYENDQAIYRIEKTSFFDVDADSAPTSKLEGFILNPEIDIAALPTVVVLDSGVNFPPEFESLIVQHWKAQSSKGGDAKHGTGVAGNVAFRYVSRNIHSNTITPRTRIIDCNILDGGVSTQSFIRLV
jgi:hypothetical protein